MNWQAAVEKTVSGLGYDLVDTERSARGLLRVYIDRLPNDPTAPVTFTIDRGAVGQPQLRSTLTIDRSTGGVSRSETFETQTLGRRLRTFARFAHTGEFFGVAGQTIAGLASAGAVVLTWTGLSLALRRLSSWRKRRRDRTVVVAQTSAA